jgi:hypothetical protein
MAKKKPTKFAKEKAQDVVAGKKMPWGFEAKPGNPAAGKKKALPQLSKGAQDIANTLSGGGMTVGPPPIGMPSNGPMQLGMMGPEMNYPAPGPSMMSKLPIRGTKKVVKNKNKKKKR